MSRRRLLTVVVLLVLAGALWLAVREADRQPALQIVEREVVLTGLAADSGATRHTVVFQLRNRSWRPHRLVGISGDT